MKIKTGNMYLDFSGTAQDALTFVRDMRGIEAATGMDYPKVFNDFLYAIELNLQHAGLLDKDFNRVEKEEV